MQKSVNVKQFIPVHGVCLVVLLICLENKSRLYILYQIIFKI